MHSYSVTPVERACSSQSLDLPSLDPPDTKRRLRKPFAFSQSRVTYSQIQSYLAVAKPFPTLPRLLIPSRRVAYKPPLMYYGWRAPRDALLAYDKKFKIRGNLRRRKLTEFERLLHGMVAVNEDVGRIIPGDMIGIHLTVVGNQEALDLVFTVYTNFDLKRVDLPSEDAVDTVRRALGIEEAPGWFLSESQWDWEPW